MPLTHDIGVRIPYPLLKRSQFVDNRHIAGVFQKYPGQFRDSSSLVEISWDVLKINVLHFCNGDAVPRKCKKMLSVKNARNSVLSEILSCASCLLAIAD